tara:strand:- start:58116 stop:60686 length:2571 start_codon:yes stop_codon:yes gene_type:complete
MRAHCESADQCFRQYCETGDPVALGEVFDSTAGPLMRVALWLVGNRTDAEDLLQRTFLKAILTREQFRVGAPVLPWLMGLLGNEARRQRRERDRAAAVRPVQDRVADPEAVAFAREFADTVRSVGDRLGAPYDEVLRLHLEAGLNCKEIAARLERPPGTVRTQLMRALDLLRRRLPNGFAAGMTVAAAVGSGALSEVRAAVVTAAHDAVTIAVPIAAPTWAAATATTTSPLRTTLITKQMLIAIPVLLLGGTAAFMPIWRHEPPPADPAHAAVTANEMPGPRSGDAAIKDLDRLLVNGPMQDPEAVALPRLLLLGAMPAGNPAVVLTADGRRPYSVVANTANTSVLLRIDRAAPWHEVTKLLHELQGQGKRQVQFAAQLPEGGAGCFTLALPMNDKVGATVDLRLHRERDGVPPSSIVPVLRRMVRGREGYLAGLNEWQRKQVKSRCPEPFAVSITAPEDAPFEQVLQVVAAANLAGVKSMLVTRTEPSGNGGSPATSPNRSPYAIDLGPYPRIAIRTRSLTPAPATVSDGVVGCTVAAAAPPPERQPGGIGQKYGRRSSQWIATREEQMGWSPTDSINAGLAWLTAAQQPDGSFLDSDGRPDVEASALVTMALLGKITAQSAPEEINVVTKSIGWILGQQRDDGCLAPEGPDCMRHHCLATYALAEAYGMMSCQELRGSLDDALEWLDQQRPEDGGFATILRDAASTPAAIMALATAEFFSVKVPVPCKQAIAWFDEAANTEDATAMSAELFCRIFVGQNPKQDEQKVAAAGRLPKAADPKDPWCMHWTTYCLFQMGGELWNTWQTRLKEIAQQQVGVGSGAGSWQPAFDNSRVTTTALRVLSLHAFNRYSRLIR